MDNKQAERRSVATGMALIAPAALVGGMLAVLLVNAGEILARLVAQPETAEVGHAEAQAAAPWQPEALAVPSDDEAMGDEDFEQLEKLGWNGGAK